MAAGGPAGLTSFRPRSQDDLAPSGSVSRVRANLAALDTVTTLQRDGRAATPEEQAVLARWSGWGAVPEVFDEDNTRFAGERDRLRDALGPRGYAASARSTLNAHYTDVALAETIWQGAARLGFTSGRVLEPGCGSGTFLGLAPEGCELVGIESEPTTAAVAAALYPHAQVRCESFADTRPGPVPVDLVIGNVPFGKIALTDTRFNRTGHSIHNHFLIKSLAMTRPGGLVMALTSRYTMDAANPAARRELAALAELVAAVRLPTGAHHRAAGTQAVTDLLVLRRRDADAEQHPSPEWERTQLVDLPGGQTRINAYWSEAADAVLGRMQVGHGLHGSEELLVTPQDGADVADRLAERLDRITDVAVPNGFGLGPHPSAQHETGSPAPPVAVVADQPEHREGHLAITDTGGFSRVQSGRLVDHPVPARQAAELRTLLELRDTVVALLEAEASTADDTGTHDDLRAELNRHYDRYAATYGPLNRFSWRRTGHTDPDTGKEKLARIYPQQGGFRRCDPYAAAVFGLEEYDSTTGQASKAAIFAQRVVAPRAPRLGADTPDDALAICLDTHGYARLDEIAMLLGSTEAEAREQLGTLVFNDPQQAGALVPAAKYLSGNVRAKLAVARDAARGDPAYQPNVDALTDVIPVDLEPGEIQAQLGAAWIDAKYVQQGLREILDDPTVTVEHPSAAIWAVRGGRATVAAAETWGTDRAPAPRLSQALLEQRPIVVRDELDDGRTVPNPTETAAAQDKAAALSARFAEWVWEDPDRAAALAREYNDRFNAVALRSYDGSHLSLPGLALTFTPHEHQRTAVARMIHEPAVGLYHEVGAGKTSEIVMGLMELRRLGMVTKPAVVVPNNMLDQFAREWSQLYPQARLLIATKDDLSSDQRRRQFVARAASGDWDGVVMTRTVFERIPLSPERQGDYVDRQVEDLRQAAKQARQNQSGSVKRVERAAQNAEEALKKKLAASKDAGITFEQTGIDYLAIDEAHGYKNLRTISNIPGAEIEGSNRAQDLDMKLDWLRATHGDRVATFATATPIANSVTEVYVMQRYLRPDLLDDAGVAHFDTWAATFGHTVTALEIGPTGSFRMQTRFAKFQNVPELLKLWHVMADVKTTDDLALPRPDLAPRGTDGQREAQTVLVESSPTLDGYVEQLGRRAEAIRSRAVRPDEDNMLKVSTDGRLAALDPRLVGLDPDAPGKVDVAADRIAAIYHATRDTRYAHADGTEHPTPGALQLVFCDLGTPAASWNVYDELRDQLVARGLDPGGIRYVHEAGSDRAKAQLFAATRDGQVSVLLGSTERMGMGTNVQTRAAALHHLDCPWRPADLHQREGRILRQGNQHPEVRILRYAAEGSFDSYLWQTVERKALFINQVLRGRLDVREIEDIGDAALSYSEVKALASGDPRVLDKAQIDAEVTRLERLQRAHDRSQHRLASTRASSTDRAQGLDGDVAALDRAIATRRSTKADAFRLTTPDGAAFTGRIEAGRRVRDQLRQLVASAHRNHTDPQQLGELGGHTLTAYRNTAGEAVIGFAGVPRTELRLTPVQLADTDPTGLVTKLENRLTGLDRSRDQLATEAEHLRDEVARAEQQLAAPFPHAAELADARDRARELDEEIHADMTKQHQQPDDDTPAKARPDLDTMVEDNRCAASDQQARSAAAANDGQPPHADAPGYVHRFPYRRAQSLHR